VNLPAHIPHYDDKWPRLIVVGTPVTPAQAEHILVRTNAYLMCNDHAWEKAARKIMGLVDMYDDFDESRREERGYLLEIINAEQASKENLGILPLNYLYNTRIASSYIGGFHGWCNWDGAIGCADYNIGKWPNEEEITEEWAQIANAFPYLNLASQAVSMCDDDPANGHVWGTWYVKDGAVTFDSGVTTLLDTSSLTGRPGIPEMCEAMLCGFKYRITLEALATAVANTRKTLDTKALPCA